METENKIEKRQRNLKKFGIDKPPANPTSAQKKAGWDRKRQAQQIMDKMLEFKDMTLQEFRAFENDIKANPDKHTVIELKLAQYISEKKNTIDFLDRHISKAPIQQEVEHSGEIKSGSDDLKVIAAGISKLLTDEPTTSETSSQGNS